MPESKPPFILIIKLSVSILLAILAPSIFISFIWFNTLQPQILLLPLVASLICLCLVYLYLKPIAKIQDGVNLFIKGEINHRINVQSGDEFSELAQKLNQLIQTNAHFREGLAQDKDFLASEKNKLNSIFSSITDGVLVLDLGKKVLLANSAAEHLTGYTSSEMAGKQIDQLIGIVDRNGRHVLSNEYYPKFTSMDPLNLVGKNAKARPIKLKSSPIVASPDANLGCIVILQDFSREKELEAIQLDFVSMASHELRTPLTSVIGYMSIFLKENDTKLSSHQKDFLNRAYVAAQQLDGIIDNLLSVSKVERGAFNITSQKINWKEFIEKAFQENQLLAIQKNLKLTLNLPAESPFVYGDPVRLTEVVNNLLSNAINYTKEGGAINLSCKLEGKEVITSVSDSGIGIPPEAMRYLFTKFFRVSGALDRSSSSKGTGLGLYISKSIIDLHHGKIWAQSQAGRGSAFSFSLPIA